MLPVLVLSGRRLLLSGKSKSVDLYLQVSQLVLRRGVAVVSREHHYTLNNLCTQAGLHLKHSSLVLMC